MKLTVVVLAVIAAVVLAVADEEQPGADRHGRLFFLSRLLKTPTLFTNSLGLGGSTTTGCPLPLFTTGCPAGQVCALGANGKVCQPQRGLGTACVTGFQCTSSLCRTVCVRDDCPLAGQQSTCVAGQLCTATGQGNRCQASTASACPTPLMTVGCPSGQYCDVGTQGNICRTQKAAGEACSVPAECTGTCRAGACRNDACLTLGTSQDCLSTQFCTTSPTGNQCSNKVATGQPCTLAIMCVSGMCTAGRCISDACLTLFSSDRCPSTDQYCTTSTNGNVCTAKLATGVPCIQAGQCQSGMCQSGRCMSNECPTENSSAGCIVATQFCQTMPNGRQCVSKLAAGNGCVTVDQCTSSLCGNGFCNACPTPTSAAGCPNGMFCAAGGMGNTCMGQLAAGGACTTDDMCTSNSCDLGANMCT